MMRNQNVHKGKVDVGPLIRNDHLKAGSRVDRGVGKGEAAVGRRSRKAGHVIMQVGNALKW
jgi:hypothetical protein